MVSIEELKKIYLLDSLTADMIENMRPMAQLQLFGEGTVIFEEGQKADQFYMLLNGKLLLEVEAAKNVTISLGAVKPGYSFGWSALLPGSSYTAFAVCVEPCEVISIPGDRFLKLLENDHTIGYRFMQSVFWILKKRLDRRTQQFLKVISKHPDIKKLLGL